MSSITSELGARDKFWSIVGEFNSCMLCSKAKDTDRLRCRPMAPRISRDRRQILFITDKTSVKCDEVGAFENVCLAFSKPDKWVSVTGKATMSTDRELISAIWDSQMDTWTAGKDDPQIGVLVVEPEIAEYWDVTANKVTQAWEFAKAYTGMKEQPDVCDNTKVSLQGPAS